MFNCGRVLAGGASRAYLIRVPFCLATLRRYTACLEVFGPSFQFTIATNAQHFKFWERWNAGQPTPAEVIVNSGATSLPASTCVVLPSFPPHSFVLTHVQVRTCTAWDGRWRLGQCAAGCPHLERAAPSRLPPLYAPLPCRATSADVLRVLKQRYGGDIASAPPLILIAADVYASPSTAQALLRRLADPAVAQAGVATPTKVRAEGPLRGG